MSNLVHLLYCVHNSVQPSHYLLQVWNSSLNQPYLFFPGAHSSYSMSLTSWEGHLSAATERPYKMTIMTVAYWKKDMCPGVQRNMDINQNARFHYRVIVAGFQYIPQFIQILNLFLNRVLGFLTRTILRIVLQLYAALSQSEQPGFPSPDLYLIRNDTVQLFNSLQFIIHKSSYYKYTASPNFEFLGNGVNCLKVAPFSAFEFFFYELFKHTFYHGRPANDYTSKLICGGLTGIAAQTLTYPLDLIRTIITIHVHHGNGPRLTVWKCGQDLYAKDGTKGLFKGLTASVIGITPFIGIKMTSFDLLKVRFLPDRNTPNFNTWNLVLGALAGTIAVTFTYPIDLIRRLIQLSGKPGHIVYNGMWDCTKKVYKADGFPGLFKGLWPCYLKVAPMTAILFMTNERLKKYFGI